MDGIHDLGGMQGFGPVEIETDEPVFHHDWEKRVFALAMAAPFVAEFGDDQFRRQIEHIPPRQYLKSSYYELWFEGMTGLLKELDVISDEELNQSVMINSIPEHFDVNNQAAADELESIVAQGESQAMPQSTGRDRFRVGDLVITRDHMTSVHNRLPRYARGKPGRVIAEHGIFVFADTNSVGSGLEPQMLYGIEFQACDLWGSEAQPGDTLCLDLWDAYLGPLA